MKTLRVVTVVILTGALRATDVGADVVVDWNAVANTTIFNGEIARRPGPAGILDFAMVHIAMHDAIQAFEGRFESYTTPIPNASGSPVAAAAQAAHDVLVARFPVQASALNAVLDGYLQQRGLVGDLGLVIGQQAALQIIDARANDGSYPPNPEIFTGGTGPGEWRPTPPAFLPMATPWLGAVIPFTLKDATSPPPPHLDSGEYVKDYNEVKSVGSLNSSTRTQEQTDLAVFYSGNFIVLWERTLRGIATANISDIGQSARLFALANTAAADAIITAWADKRHWNFWRPSTAIQEGDIDGNPRTAGDAAWIPFLINPPYPDYTSGANALTGAMTRTLERFFGDSFTFVVTSAIVSGTRMYYRFSDMAQDVVDVRVYHGVHFRTADEVGRREGKRAGDWAFSHFLRPL